MNQQEIKRFFNASNPSKTLDMSNIEDKKYYIDFTSVRGVAINEELKRTILLSNGTTCQLFTGHIGCGKSTELRHLKADLTHDLSDILLAIARRVSESLQEQQINVEVSYFRRLFAEIADLLQMPLDLSFKTEVSVGIAKITAQAKESPQLRNQLRDILEPRTRSILEAINEELLAKAIVRLKQKGKQGLVVIVDNLDLMDSRTMATGKSQPEYLFIERGAQLRRLHCHMIYTLPLALSLSHQSQVMANCVGVEPQVLPMVPVRWRNGQDCSEGLALLQQMVLARAFPEESSAERLAKVTSIFDEVDTLDRLCRVSGGHVRNLIHLLYRCLQMQDPLISRACLERAITDRQDPLRIGIEPAQWEILRQIAQQKSCNTSNPEHQAFLRNLLIFGYRDAKGRWFDINPILAEVPEMQL
jgi:energy-coupling factor transporter ATP-binding protein EcfA2